MNEPHFYIFSDGSCGRGKDDIGAYAAFVVGRRQRKLLYGVAHPTTVSRMEMTPILEGLRWISRVTKHARGIRVRGYSDSEFTVRTLSGDCAPAKNLDLWHGITEVSDGLSIEYRWWERNSHKYLQLCDAVCSRLRKRTIAQVTEMLGGWKDMEHIVPAYELPPDDGDTIKQGLNNAYVTRQTTQQQET